jgi:hypothetical protein
MKTKLITLAACVMLAGCVPPPFETSPSRLPLGAKVVRDLGNQWMIIDISGAQYVYRNYNDSRTDILAPWVGELPEGLKHVPTKNEFGYLRPDSMPLKPQPEAAQPEKGTP